MSGHELLAAMARSPEAIERTKLIFLGIGFASVWSGMVVYLVSLANRQKRLERRLAALDPTTKSD
ncbi:MAG: CcmD family protein [Actinomycetota bacterium]|nr:CcmD family protein [Actinomycetota bacterium]